MKTELPVTAASVEASSAVETTASSVEAAAEARLTTGGESSRDSSMIKAAERAGVATGLGMRRRKSMLRGYESMLRGRSMDSRTSARTPALKSASAMKSAAMIEVPVPAIEGVVIDENSAVRHEGVVVEGDMAVIPVRSPMVPSPAEPAKKADAKAQAKPDSRAGEK